MEIIESLFFSLLVFLINGVSVFNYFKIKDWLLTRVLADFYSFPLRGFVSQKKETLISIFLLISLFLPKFSFSFLWLFILTFSLILLFLKRKELIKKIKLTPKGLIILSLLLLLNFFLFKISSNNLTLIFFTSLFFSQFFLLSFSIFIFEILVFPYLFLLRLFIKRKLKKTKIKKIIIVGSYGKSSTKEFLVQILSKKHKVLSLPPRINHEYSILKFLLKQDLNNFDFLVLELGSYFLGNIKWITKAIIPDYLFITGITKQHYFLFGEKILNVIRAEGTEALSYMKEGKVFVNSNHEYFEELLKEIKKNILNKNIKLICYGKIGDYSFQILENDLKEIKFQLKIKDSVFFFETNIIFPQQIENLVGVLSFLLEEKIFSFEELKNYVKNLKLPEGFLKLKTRDRFFIFDDSYNANPRGVIEGLNFFKNLDFDFKVIIFNGLWELGKETKKVLKDIALKMKNFDLIIFTSQNFYELFKEELKEKAVFIKNDEELKNFLEKLKFKKIGIWIFNRFPERFKNFLK